MAENKDGAEKTEDATLKHLTDAREKGQVAKSSDLTTAGIIMLGGLMVFTLGKTMLSKMRAFFSSSFSSVGQFDFTETNLLSHAFGIVKLLAEILLPLMLLLVVVALATEISQVGFKIATKKWTTPENWSKPFKLLSGFKRVFFSSRSIIELLKGFLKILALGSVAFYVIQDKLEYIMEVVLMPFDKLSETMADVGFEILVKVGSLFVAIAFGDFL